MAMAFVATSAPSGWKLGKWTQSNKTTWQEEKLDNSKLVYSFQLVNGPATMPGSGTVRLKMKDQNTEVLLLDSSAQVFVNGSYFGEYGGRWEAAGAQSKQGSKASAAAPAQAPAAAAQPQRRPASKEAEQGPAFEQTLAPAQAQAAKKAPPPAAAPQAQKAAPPAGGRTASREPAPAPVAAPARQQFAPPPEMQTRPRKPEGLDNSDKSMMQLIEAAKNGDVKKVNELLASGIDPDGPAKNGNTPLMAATSGGHLNVVEALVAAFADPTLGKGAETPLTIAFQKGKQDILKALFAASFDSLDRNIKGSGISGMPESSARGDSEVPENAEGELRAITAMIAKVNNERPVSPDCGKKYGNYSHLMTVKDGDEKDSDMLREQSVRLAMKSLVKTTNEMLHCAD